MQTNFANIFGNVIFTPDCFNWNVFHAGKVICYVFGTLVARGSYTLSFPNPQLSLGSHNKLK